MLVDKDYRQKIISNLKDPVIKAFWVHEYEAWQDKFRNEAIAPIQNKVGQFLSTSIIRNVVGQQKSTINIFDMMNEGKIFLVNVSKGRVGEDNSALLGGMIITKIQLAAMERVRIPEDDRKDFYLYIDEFHNIVTQTFENILSEARKYGLNLTMAHQYVGQIITKVHQAVLGNCGSIITFRIGGEDAVKMKPEFSPLFDVKDMINLAVTEFYIKMTIDGESYDPFSAETLRILPATHPSYRDEIIAASRRKYSIPKDDAQKLIAEEEKVLAEEFTRAELPYGRGTASISPSTASVGAAARAPPSRPTGRRRSAARARRHQQGGATEPDPRC